MAVKVKLASNRSPSQGPSSFGRRILRGALIAFLVCVIVGTTIIFGYMYVKYQKRSWTNGDSWPRGLFLPTSRRSTRCAARGSDRPAPHRLIHRTGPAQRRIQHKSATGHIHCQRQQHRDQTWTAELPFHWMAPPSSRAPVPPWIRPRVRFQALVSSIHGDVDHRR